MCEANYIDPHSFQKHIKDALQHHFPHIVNPSKEQIGSWKAIFLRKDLLAVLPTGSGKSIIYQACPDIALELTKMEKGHEDKSIVVVLVTSLTIVIKTQISELRSLGIKAVNLPGEINDGTEKGINY